MNNRKILITTWFLLCFTGTVGQQEERDYILKNPEVVRIELLPGKFDLAEDADVPNAPYEVGSKIRFRIAARNTSIQPVAVLIGRWDVQNRPDLLRGGQLVTYREGLVERLQAIEQDPYRHTTLQVGKLEPNQQKSIGILNLEDWYEPLQPGHYQLTLKHRFEPGQDWVESSSITFEVVPKKQDDHSRTNARRL